MFRSNERAVVWPAGVEEASRRRRLFFVTFRPIYVAFVDFDCKSRILIVCRSYLDSLVWNRGRKRRFRRGLGPAAAKMPFGPQTYEEGEV